MKETQETGDGVIIFNGRPSPRILKNRSKPERAPQALYLRGGRGNFIEGMLKRLHCRTAYFLNIVFLMVRSAIVIFRVDEEGDEA